MKIKPLSEYKFDVDGFAVHHAGTFTAVLEKLANGEAIARAIKVEKKLFEAMSPLQLKKVISLAKAELALRGFT